jgi:hypothetical protein
MMDATQRAAFISDYAKVVVSTWNDARFAAELEAHPASALASCGLQTQANAKFNIVRSPSGSGDIDLQVNAWERGETTGEYTLYVPPSERSVQSVELDSQDLESLRRDSPDLSIGTIINHCCCCPCCCCT